jgi:uncharacterized protein (TIGR00730 family)
MKIGITLTSSLHVGQEYIDLTRDAAKKLAELGYSVVYGGTSYGMMLELADTYKKYKGKELIGVMAKDLVAVTRGYEAYKQLDGKYLEETIGQRIAKITNLSDAILILPGGYGTFEELAVMIGAKVNKLWDKPIAMLNYNGFYDTLILFFKEIFEKEFSKIRFEDMVFVSQNMGDIINHFENYKPTEIADKFVS